MNFIMYKLNYTSINLIKNERAGSVTGFGGRVLRQNGEAKNVLEMSSF